MLSLSLLIHTPSSDLFSLYQLSQERLKLGGMFESYHYMYNTIQGLGQCLLLSREMLESFT